MMGYNPYSGLAQMQAENQQMLQQMYTPPVGVYTPQRRRGDYVEVASEQEMQAASVRMDGTPTLFINFGQHVMWSKKYANGKVEVDIFQFNRPEFSTAVTDEIEIEDVPPDTIVALTERIERLEASLTKKRSAKNETVDQ